MVTKKEESSIRRKDESNRLQPSIDSYIVNTIKLNKILRNQVSFDQIDFFTRPTKKAIKFKATEKSKISRRQEVLSSKDVRECLKNFIVIMSLHCGLTSKLFKFFISILSHALNRQKIKNRVISSLEISLFLDISKNFKIILDNRIAFFLWRKSKIFSLKIVNYERIKKIHIP